MERIVLISELFDVTTDYLLKGIEPSGGADGKRGRAVIFAIAATALNFIGLIIACAVWYEVQAPIALVAGLIFMALGCMIFGIGSANVPQRERGRAKRWFWWQGRPRPIPF